MQEQQLENINQQATRDQNDPYQLFSQHSTEEHSSKQDGLYYKNLAGFMICVLVVVSVFLAVSYEP